MKRRARSIGLTEERFEKSLGGVLRAGVAASAILVACGGGLYLFSQPEVSPDYHVFRAAPADMWSLSGILSGLTKSSGRGLIQLGVLVLIATPMVRVACCLVGFALRSDWLYVGVSVIVLTLLAYSLTIG